MSCIVHLHTVMDIIIIIFLLHLQVKIMILLLTFLRCIGEFDTWHSNIFQFLLCAKSTTNIVKEVAAFFYGNGLSLRYATLIYLLCNEQASFLTSHTLFTFYSFWHSDKTTSNHAQYYNMKHKKFLWINGLDHLRMEPVLLEKSNITLGVN
jgi:hypothetical protein